MSSTSEILDQATKLGELIAEHDTAKRLEQAVAGLQNDLNAQRAMTDLNRYAQSLEQKARQGQPIEVEEKRKLESLETAVVTNPLLTGMQKAQMDYVDLLRKVDEAITGKTPDAPASIAGP
ncbi:MAG: YlbF family regulator [Planctomycetota bacterium]